MRHCPSAWMTELVEAVAGCMEAHSAMGARGWRYREEDDLAEGQSALDHLTPAIPGRIL